MPGRRGPDRRLQCFHPNITIEPQIVPWADYWTKLQTGVAGGSTYDVFWMNADGLPIYASQGALVSIQDLIDDGSIDAEAYPESLRSIYTFEGTAYGIPRDFDTIALFFNKDHFDAAGRGIPDRRLDLGRPARCGRAADHQGRRYRLAMGLSLVAGRPAELLQPDLAERRPDPQRGSDRVDAGRAGGLRGASQFAGDFIAEGLSPSVAVMQANDPHEMLFPAGVISMIFGGSWYARTFSEANPAIAVVPMPQGKQRATAIHGLANVIWSGGQNQCAALEWVKFLASPEAEQILATRAPSSRPWPACRRRG